MKRRKLIASLLAMAITLGLSVPAFAADTEVNNGQTTADITVTSKLVVPTIEVTIGASPAAVVNPYEIEYKNTALGINTPDTSSFISSPTLITNKSDVGITVAVTPTVTKENGSNVTFSSSATIPENTAVPTVAMYLQLKTAAKADLTQTDAVTWDTSFQTGTHAMITEGNTSSLSINLAVGKTTNTYGAFKICGESGGKGWSSNDTFTVKLAFTFTPQGAYTEPAA